MRTSSAAAGSQAGQGAQAAGDVVVRVAREGLEVAHAIANIQGVTLAEDVTGPYDVIVRAEAASVDELGQLVVARVQTVPGITRTVTCPVVHI